MKFRFHLRPTAHDPGVYEAVNAPERWMGLYVMRGVNQVTRIDGYGTLDITHIDEWTKYYHVEMDDQKYTESPRVDLHPYARQRLIEHRDLIKYVHDKVQSELVDNEYAKEALYHLTMANRLLFAMCSRSE